MRCDQPGFQMRFFAALTAALLPGCWPGNLYAEEKPALPPVLRVDQDPPRGGGGDPVAETELQIQRSERPRAPCQLCGDDGKQTLESAAKPYLLFENQEPLTRDEALGWKPCPGCLRGMAAQKRYDAEPERLATRLLFCRQHEEEFQMPFLDFETRYVSGHFQTSSQEALDCGTCLERVVAVLRERCGEGFLTTSPATHRIVVLENQARYEAYLKGFAARAPGGDDQWLALALKSSSFGSRTQTLIRRDALVKGAGLGPMVVFSFGQMLIKDASDGKAPGWFAEGFSSLCESLIFPVPRCYSIRYEENRLEFENAPWSKLVADSMRAGKARAWESLFYLEQIGLSKLDYQLFWSTVTYLLSRDAEAFTKLPRLFKSGMNSKDAIEKAYATPLASLEGAYRMWARNPR